MCTLLNGEDGREKRHRCMYNCRAGMDFMPSPRAGLADNNPLAYLSSKASKRLLSSEPD